MSTAAAGDREDFGGQAVKKNKLSPAACYALSKIEAEQKLGELAQEAELDVVIIKPPGVYGPDMKANFLRLFELVDRGIPLPLASVDNRRSFIYLDNLVDALVRCCFHPNAGGQTFMVADGEDISTPELVRVIGKSLGRPVRLFPCPPFLLRAGGRICGVADNMERLLGSLRIDNTRIVRELNWQPPFSMAAGLRETAKWYLHQGRAGKRSGQAAEDK